jgi:hypothetical protein
MSSFQDVRGAMAKLTSDALVVDGTPPVPVPCVFDNVEETPPKDAAGRYAVINISFPQSVIETIGCKGMDYILGNCNVLLYTPKREGMKPAEDLMQKVLKEWVRVNKAGVVLLDTTNKPTVHLHTRNISGPNALAPDQRPHQVTQLSCAFTAWIPEPA